MQTLPRVDFRQWTLSLPGALRWPVVKDAALLRAVEKSLQLTPHLHVLVPEGVFGDDGFVALPPPSQEDVEAVLVRAVTRLLPLFQDRQPPWPEDDFEVLQAQGAQLRLLPPEEPRPGRKGRLAVAHGLSLHADTKGARQRQAGPRHAVPLWSARAHGFAADRGPYHFFKSTNFADGAGVKVIHPPV
jgi:hypothetical protein